MVVRIALVAVIGPLTYFSILLVQETGELVEDLRRGRAAVGKAFLLAVVGVGGISAVDKFLRPMIIGKRTRLPFLFIFFSVLGGIQFFGIIGFVVGPMVLALFISVIEIFRTLGEESPQRLSRN